MRLRVLTLADGHALGALCCAQALWMAAVQEIEKQGETVSEPVLDRQRNLVGHKVRKNPAVTIAAEFLKITKSYLAEFGLTPSSRARVPAAPPEMSPEEKKFNDYMARRG